MDTQNYLVHHELQQKLVKSKRSRKSSQNNEGVINKSSKKAETALKVVYISTPMKVTTSASKFRDIVQELTGRESDVVKIMESCGGKDTWTVHDDDDDHKVAEIMMKDEVNERCVRIDDGSSPSVSSSEEHVEHFDSVFVKGQDSNFDYFDHSSLLFDQFFHQLDVLGNYYE